MRPAFDTLLHQPTSPTICAALRRAHEMMNIGDYAHAAIAFEQLAHAAETRNGRRTPYLLLQAGRARVLNNQSAAAMPHLKQGLELLSASGRYTQLYKTGHRVAQELKLRGLEREAREIVALVSSGIPAIADIPTERGPDVAIALLPTRCESCGGLVHPSEIEWLDLRIAECPYCGHSIPTP